MALARSVPLLVGTQLIVCVAISASVHPFFFVCQYHTLSEQNIPGQSEASLSVSLKGNPNHYIPNEEYEVLVTSSADFDGLFVTGLYTLPRAVSRAPPLFPSFNHPLNALGTGLLCSVVHSHLSSAPHKHLSFKWLAPPPGTGCVDFLATATLSQEIMFKDVLVLQICEEGAAEEVGELLLSGIRQDGVILREDFDGNQHLDHSVWTDLIGGNTSNACGVVASGVAAVFCRQDRRVLITQPLNMSAASVLQFSLSSGTCPFGINDPPVSVYLGANNCTTWMWLESFVPGPNVITHLIHIPFLGKTESTCVKWEQHHRTYFNGCWAIDNILLLNEVTRKDFLKEDFDPTDVSQWLFYPGANVQKKCQSEGNALVFGGQKTHINYASTIDIGPIVDAPFEDVFLEENFDAELSKRWLAKGGSVSQKCGVLNHKKAFVFDGSGVQRICSPYVDSTKIKTIRFVIKNCAHEYGHNFTRDYMTVFAELSNGIVRYLEKQLVIQTKASRTVSLVVSQEAQALKTRFCWQHQKHTPHETNVWAIDGIQMLPWQPKETNHVIQFKVNLQCEKDIKENSFKVEFSNDEGHSWHNLHVMCLPGLCVGSNHNIKSDFTESELEKWERVTLPLPYAALSGSLRIRFLQTGKGYGNTWAVDNVYIGECQKGCSGHGICSDKQCICDFGFRGEVCNMTILENPSFLSETFSGTTLHKNSNILQVKGAELGFKCGILGAGKAVTFDKSGTRSLTTRDLNTSRAKYLEFTVYLGNGHDSVQCPMTNYGANVFVHFSCDGGILWHLLEHLEAINKYPRRVSVTLPDAARQSSCRFRMWQPQHSGLDRDMWAIDDLVVTESLMDSLYIDFTDVQAMNKSLNVHAGKVVEYCNRQNVLRYFENYFGTSAKHLETRPFSIGPSSMIQFDLVIGCDITTSTRADNKVHLEFSTNNGNTWKLVHNPCTSMSNNGACSNVYGHGTIYDASEFYNWKRITISLPKATWSSSTTFRLRHSSSSDSWALDHLYIGQQCPDLCSGHGYCVGGQCRCDNGFFGASCVPISKLKSSAKNSFNSRKEISEFHIVGGSVIDWYDLGSLSSSGSAAYFYKNGVRQLTTNDLNTRDVDFVRFVIQMGNTDSKTMIESASTSAPVLFQYSNNGGVSWNIVKNLKGTLQPTPELEHIQLPFGAKTNCTRIQWWQPRHSGTGKDQWVIDEILIDKWPQRKSMCFFSNDSSLEFNEMWSAASKYAASKYCGSVEDVMLFDGIEQSKFAVTFPLNLKPGDIVQFKINPGCPSKFSADAPIYVEYSHDYGSSWSLLQNHCYPGDVNCAGSYHESSVYYNDPANIWMLSSLVLDSNVAYKEVMFRWMQNATGYSETNQFALDKLYIGSPCPNMCSGHGICRNARCECDAGYTGSSCYPGKPLPTEMIDSFNDKPSEKWDKISGGYLSLGCGLLSTGKSLYFSGPGARHAITKDIDTNGIQVIQFVIKIGSRPSLNTCKKPSSHKDNVILEYSNNGGVTWYMLRELSHKAFSKKAQPVHIVLPDNAKTSMTRFKFWQPLNDPPGNRTEWALDDVFIAASDITKLGFQDNFESGLTSNWFKVQGGNIKDIHPDQSDRHVLQFDSNQFVTSFAETWDFRVQPSTFLQFDIRLKSVQDLELQYSLDMGQSWNTLIQPCYQMGHSCNSYELGTKYNSPQYANFTRVTVHLPQPVSSSPARFRWILQSAHSDSASWAIDKVYLGDGCPWFCSGHGYCNNSQCICDEGFSGDLCVPANSLPCELEDTFDDGDVLSSKWAESCGEDIGLQCGSLISGSSLHFYKEGIRLLTTHDLDTTNSQYLQFTLQYGCHLPLKTDASIPTVIVIMYSVNGGITWQLLKELYFQQRTSPTFYTVPLTDGSVRRNATRFRFWQPNNFGKHQADWAIDNVVISGLAFNPNVLYDTFEGGFLKDAWLSWPNGKLGHLCSQNETQTSMVFEFDDGLHAAFTRDMDITEDFVIQFNIKVGCEDHLQTRHPVRLEYSTDFGLTWSLVRKGWTSLSNIANAFEAIELPTVYTHAMFSKWTRVVIPMPESCFSRNTRFRWYQGTFVNSDMPDHWAIDNVYIGPACFDHCSGHGYCINGLYCHCDTGFAGDSCDISLNGAQSFLKEEFEDSLFNTHILESWSGGKISRSCGVLFSGLALVFQGSGLRALTTENLDLTLVRTVDFHLRLGCQNTLLRSHQEPVLLQYSINGGVGWNIIRKFDFLGALSKVHYYSLLLPDDARTFSTKLRWWQPSEDSTISEDWAIDQLNLGVSVAGAATLNDEPQLPQTTWNLVAGSESDYVCGSSTKMLHFTGIKERFAMTADIDIIEGSFIQFELSVGCGNEDSCYDVELHFSCDLGENWAVIYERCSPLDKTGCDHVPTVYSSTVYYGRKRITALLPSHMWSRMIRFRWIQKPVRILSQTWGLGLVHIGNDCTELCSGHGTCFRSACLCDVGWSGIHCGQPDHILPTSLIDRFESAPSSPNWLRVIGGVTSGLCGAVASGLALHFYGVCSRELVTSYMDLQKASFVQFYLRFGCISGSLSSDTIVSLQYSTNNGISWRTIQHLHSEYYQSPRLVTITLPENAKTNGVQLRWWQPVYDDTHASDWVVDDVVVGEITSSRYLHNEFEDSNDWLFNSNVRMSHYCGSENSVAVGIAQSSGKAFLETTDVAVKDYYVLQFKLAVACNTSHSTPGSSLSLQYSTDFGNTWFHFIINCTAPGGLSSCKDGLLPSVYFGPMNWRRIVLPLPKTSSSHFRFRWLQDPSTSQHLDYWAVTDVYVGLACSNFCSGHGTCFYNLQCICDKGYFGSTCQYSNDNPTYLKDDFSEDAIDTTKWNLVLGGDITKPCVELGDGNAIMFAGQSIHTLETVDLDLRNAKFIQFKLLTCCQEQADCSSYFISKSLSIYLQFSINEGTSWETLREYSTRHSVVLHEYILLPEPAMTSGTRLRWHKMSPLDSITVNKPTPWIIDNVFIGGFAINPAHFQESFADILSPSWEFVINGKILTGTCEDGYNNAMSWMPSKVLHQHSITTGELLVTEGFIIQFKITVGCGTERLEHDCTNNFGVRLEFTKEPGSGDWQLVLPKCSPDVKFQVNCAPYQSQDHSVYYADLHPKWTRITLKLPEETFSSNTQFRWIQDGTSNVGGFLHSWALDDVYLGDSCYEACNGRGNCVQGNCICDDRLLDSNCRPAKTSSNFISPALVEDFENNSKHMWLRFIGGLIGSGCGSVATGYHLYFNGCAHRQAVTMELDTSGASTISFVLRIGTPQNYSSCNVLIDSTNDYQNSVILQYTKNRGVTWDLIAIHRPQDFLLPLTVTYNIPEQAKGPGVQFRWSQQTHAGAGHDQWAIDNLEINLNHKRSYYGFPNSDVKFPFRVYN